MKIQLENNVVLPLNKLMKFHALTIVIRQVFEKGNVFYPQIFLSQVCLSNIRQGLVL